MEALLQRSREGHLAFLAPALAAAAVALLLAVQPVLNQLPSGTTWTMANGGIECRTMLGGRVETRNARSSVDTWHEDTSVFGGGEC